MQTSETIASLFAALASAQGEMEGAKKTRENAAFKQGGKTSTYADLASGWDACREALSKNGLAVIQLPGECANQRVSITTMLCHKSGEWIRETLDFPIGQVSAHGLGSAITYGRRYSLFAMVGLAPEDDDGNSANAAAPVANLMRYFESGSGRQKREPLTGPMKTRAEARVKCGEIVRELNACGDSDQLEAYLSTEKEVLSQIERELPYFWEGDGMDFLGLAKEIESARARMPQ